MIMPFTMQKVFHNPYIYSGVLIARLTTCLATFLWALIVLAHPLPLSEFLGDAMSGVRVEQPWQSVLGGAALVLAVFQLWCTIRWVPQRIATEMASFSMVLLWTIASLGAWASSTSHASGTACTTAVMFLSWWNMVTPPKRFY